MKLQDEPICMACDQAATTDVLVYQAPCGDPQCPSAVWHGTCLMRYRETEARRRATA